MSTHVADINVVSEGAPNLSANSAIDPQNAHIVKASPFGVSSDPHLLQNDVYASALVIVSQAIYSLANSVFSYETPGAKNLIDAHLQVWAQGFQIQNASGAVPLFHRLEPRSGAASAIFGFVNHPKARPAPITVILGANALAYLHPALAMAQRKVPLSLNISAVDFHAETGTFFSNYISPLSAARKLGVPVISPVSYDAPEIQYCAVLNNFLAFLTQGSAVLLFDGPEYARLFQRFQNVVSMVELGRLYQSLLTFNSPELQGLDHAVEVALDAFNHVAGTRLKPFEYTGHTEAETVFVVHGPHEAAQVSLLVTKASFEGDARVGVIKVRVPFPFGQRQFATAIPGSASNVVVFSSASSSALKADVASSLYLAGRFSCMTVQEFVFSPDYVWSPMNVCKTLSSYAPEIGHAINRVSSKALKSVTRQEISAFTSPQGLFMIWARDSSGLVATAGKLALSLSLDNSKDVSIRNKYDTSVGGGVFQSSIMSVSKNTPISAVVDAADLVVVEHTSLLAQFDVLATAKPGATVLLVNHKKIANSVEADVVEKLPKRFRRSLANSHLKLVVVDISIIEELDAVSDLSKGFSADLLLQIGFWRAALPDISSFIVNKLLQGNGNDFELLAAVLDKFIATVDDKQGLKPVGDLTEWLKINGDEQDMESTKKHAMEEPAPEILPIFPKETSFFPNGRRKQSSSSEVSHVSSSEVATKLAFPEAYGVTKELRPDLPVKNFVVKVQENKRLTPSEYSRNIFHIEFDVTGTGLTYDIGEALGIHGRNNSTDVNKFLHLYGVDGDSLVEVPNKDDPSLLEIRSARQALAENVDFLGKPPKRFYESLAPFASDDTEKAALEKLASAAGAEDLKSRQDVDFDSYMDILEEFQSARPSFDSLMRIIGPLKRREYSIASSQKMHPNALHLLIVVVDWIDSRGRKRFGHCSKYVSDLKIGDELVVSIKPSVMKLPKLTEQPIVMSGLGTGLAPFKAFIEEKIWQKAQGHKIGEIYLFMGSRHKKEEYLYGELWEAYKAAGILTHIGAAFSRDQSEKIYIQDKIRSSIEELTSAIVEKNGSFYLCGPTWPVPDITACLADILQNGAKRQGKDVIDVAKVLEGMKEDGRYILEVY